MYIIELKTAKFIMLNVFFYVRLSVQNLNQSINQIKNLRFDLIQLNFNAKG